MNYELFNYTKNHLIITKEIIPVINLFFIIPIAVPSVIKHMKIFKWYYAGKKIGKILEIEIVTIHESLKDTNY